MLAAMLTFLAWHVALILSLSLSAGQLPVFGPEIISIDAFLLFDSSFSTTSSIEYLISLCLVRTVNVVSVRGLKLLICSEEVRTSLRLFPV